jgi:hypothetical protein
LPLTPVPVAKLVPCTPCACESLASHTDLAAAGGRGAPAVNSCSRWNRGETHNALLGALTVGAGTFPELGVRAAEEAHGAVAQARPPYRNKTGTRGLNADHAARVHAGVGQADPRLS